MPAFVTVARSALYMCMYNCGGVLQNDSLYPEIKYLPRYVYVTANVDWDCAFEIVRWHRLIRTPHSLMSLALIDWFRSSLPPKVLCMPHLFSHSPAPTHLPTQVAASNAELLDMLSKQCRNIQRNSITEIQEKSNLPGVFHYMLCNRARAGTGQAGAGQAGRAGAGRAGRAGAGAG